LKRTTIEEQVTHLETFRKQRDIKIVSEVMSSTNTMLPIVDIKYMTENYLPWNANYLQDFHNDPKILQLADEIFNAFQTSGFLYLKNHSFSEELIENGYKLSKEFFQMPLEIKNIQEKKRT